MTQYEVTGELKEVKGGLVDFIAEGYVIRDGERIPCEIGFTKYGDEEVEETHIFIKNGITEGGNHYYAETIEL